MIRTSYFTKVKDDPNAVSISSSTPNWFKGRVYSKLSPTQDMMRWWKSSDKSLASQTEFIRRYHHEVLDKLNPLHVINEIGMQAILTCWESSGCFCHRYEAAKWLIAAIVGKGNPPIKVDEV